MDQNYAEHLGLEIRIIGEGLLQKIIDTARCFNAGKAAPGNHECKERRPILLGDILVGRSYDVRPPAVDAASALEEVGPLVFVPRHGDDPMPSSSLSLRRWPSSFHVAWTGDRP